MNGHPAADLFPLLEGDAFTALVDDVRANGQQQPILIYEDQILDGRNRWRACEAIGIAPNLEIYAGDDPVGLVISMNLARRHMGESERAMVAARLAGLPRGRPRADKAADLPVFSQAQAAAHVNVSERLVRDAVKVRREGTPEIVEAVDRGEITVGDAVFVANRSHDDQREVLDRARTHNAKLKKAVVHMDRDRQRAEIEASPPSLPSGRFECLVLDPPWQYDMNEYDPQWRRTAPGYAVMPLHEIEALPIPDIAADDAVIWLWTTKDFLAPAFALLDGWGFEYRNVVTWVKPAPGFGRWLRGQAEFVLLGTRGKPYWPAAVPTNVLEAPRREHSRKPDEFYAMVEELCPGRRLDFFSRQPREGWAQYGDQADAFEGVQ